MKFTFMCACVKLEERKIYSKIKFGVSKVDGYDFTHPCDGPQNRYLFFKLPSVDIKFYMPVVQVMYKKVFIPSNI
jgi:hypothetical protein